MTFSDRVLAQTKSHLFSFPSPDILRVSFFSPWEHWESVYEREGKKRERDRKRREREHLSTSSNYSPLYAVSFWGQQLVTFWFLILTQVLEESSIIRSQETSVKRTLAATDLAGPLGRLHGTLIRLEGNVCPDLATDQPWPSIWPGRSGKAPWEVSRKSSGLGWISRPMG